MVNKKRNFIELFENFIATGSLLLMLLIVITEIVVRNFFNWSFQWAEEVARYLMIWSVYFAAASLIRSKGHLRIEILIDRAPQKIKYFLNIFADIWIAVLGIALTISGYQFVDTSFFLGFTSADSNFPLKLAWVYLVIPVTYCLTAVHATLHIINIFRK